MCINTFRRQQHFGYMLSAFVSGVIGASYAHPSTHDLLFQKKKTNNKRTSLQEESSSQVTRFLQREWFSGDISRLTFVPLFLCMASSLLQVHPLYAYISWRTCLSLSKNKLLFSAYIKSVLWVPAMDSWSKKTVITIIEFMSNQFHRGDRLQKAPNM